MGGGQPKVESVVLGGGERNFSFIFVPFGIFDIWDADLFVCENGMHQSIYKLNSLVWLQRYISRLASKIFLSFGFKDTVLSININKIRINIFGFLRLLLQFDRRKRKSQKSAENSIISNSYSHMSFIINWIFPTMATF